MSPPATCSCVCVCTGVKLTVGTLDDLRKAAKGGQDPDPDSKQTATCYVYSPFGLHVALHPVVPRRWLSLDQLAVLLTDGLLRPAADALFSVSDWHCHQTASSSRSLHDS